MAVAPAHRLIVGREIEPVPGDDPLPERGLIGHALLELERTHGPAGQAKVVGDRRPNVLPSDEVAASDV